MLIVYYEVSVIVTICINQAIDDKKHFFLDCVA